MTTVTVFKWIKDTIDGGRVAICETFEFQPRRGLVPLPGWDEREIVDLPKSAQDAIAAGRDARWVEVIQ